VNEPFTVTVNYLSIQQIHCLIVGVLNYIPTINNRLAFSGSSSSASILTGSVLFDYQAYIDAYQYDKSHIKNSAGYFTNPDINEVWLSTDSAPASLASVRTSLMNGKYRVTHIADRRLLLATLQSDPLYLILNAMLAIGTMTALLLALLGDLLISWLGTRLRLVSFVTLRALGTTSRQITRVLTWEQAIVHLAGFVLGGAFGLLLATSVIPALTLTNINSNLSSEQFFALQSSLGAQLVVPPSLVVVIILGVAIYALALSMMVFMVSRPALSQTLRLSED
jgi:ABC-type antimicrobial peptide transport system permease subunit